MKGSNKKQVKNKKVFRQKGGSSKAARRAHLHSGNQQWNRDRKLKQKSKRTAATLPGTPRGRCVRKSNSKLDCDCGKCHNQ